MRMEEEALALVRRLDNRDGKVYHICQYADGSGSLRDSSPRCFTQWVTLEGRVPVLKKLLSPTPTPEENLDCIVSALRPSAVDDKEIQAAIGQLRTKLQQES